MLGLVWCFGWSLGITESLSVTLIIGLSVDYVVHFAMHYIESPFERRAVRALHTIQGMGSTVLGGAMTSMGASFMLVACWLQFFYKFGVFFLLTILFSLLWAMFFFVPVLSAIGPEGPRHAETWSLRPLVARATQALCKRKRTAKVEPSGIVPTSM